MQQNINCYKSYQYWKKKEWHDNESFGAEYIVGLSIVYDIKKYQEKRMEFFADIGTKKVIKNKEKH